MFENKKILILGLARSGYQAAITLVKRGNTVVLNDSKKEENLDCEQINKLKELGVQLVFGAHPDDLLNESFDYLVKNPGVPIDHKYVLKAHELGIEVINEVEVAYRLLPKGVKIIGITGTNGKTTTTTLTYEIMKEAYGERVFLVGNIGFPLCSILDKVKEDSILVMEVSCQQLENLKEFRPDVAIMTNLSPAHIDFFKTYENYKKVKAKLFSNQTSKDIAILNLENEDVVNECRDIKSTVKYFSSSKEISGCYVDDEAIYYYGEKVINISDILIVGMHNIENCMAAIMAVKEFDVSNEIIRKIISNFKGVEHRLEYVGEVFGVKYYNDTEATNIKCTQIALGSFNKPIVLILGGMERGQDFNELIPYIKNVKAIIAIGECRKRVLEFGSEIGIPTYSYEFLKDGFKKCVEVAKNGDIVLLSPASASWDQYKECEIRGKEFKDYVEELKKEENKEEE